MRSPFFLRPLLPALLALAPAVSARAQDPPAAPEEVTVEAPAAQDWTALEAAIDAPLKVGEVELTGADVRGHLISVKGRTMVDSRRVDLMIDAEIARRAEAGEDVSVYEVPEAEAKAAFDQAVGQIRTQYPNLALETVLAANQLSIGSLQRSLVQTKRFDMVFLPDDPEAWPPVTMAALEAQMEPAMAEQMKQSWALRAQAGDAAANQGAAMMSQFLRQMVRQALTQGVVVKTAADGLPSGIVQRVDGLDLTVDEIWPLVRPIVAMEDVARARRFLARYEAVRQDLAARGAWLDDAAFAALYGEEEAVGEGTPFNLEFVTLVLKRYPDMDSYKRILRALKSYEASIQDELVDEVLTDWLPRASRLLGLGEVDCQILLVSAMDQTTGQWLDDGWERAATRAQEVVDRLLASEGADWDVLLEEYSDFYDPPVQAQPGQAPPDKKNKGRFGRIHRNLLMRQLGESEYTSFVDGGSVADIVYYDQEVGALDGPFKGLHGYYMTRVDARTNGQKPILLSDPAMRDLVVQDYVMQHFITYGAECLDAAEVTGLE